MLKLSEIEAADLFNFGHLLFQMDLDAVRCKNRFLNSLLIEEMYKCFAIIFDTGDDEVVRDRFLSLHFKKSFFFFFTLVCILKILFFFSIFGLVPFISSNVA